MRSQPESEKILIGLVLWQSVCLSSGPTLSGEETLFDQLGEFALSRAGRKSQYGAYVLDCQERLLRKNFSCRCVYRIGAVDCRHARGRIRGEADHSGFVRFM